MKQIALVTCLACMNLMPSSVIIDTIKYQYIYHDTPIIISCDVIQPSCSIHLMILCICAKLVQENPLFLMLY